MSFSRSAYIPPQKPNFINSNQPQITTMANNSAVAGRMNDKSTSSMLMDKLARPALSAAIGLTYLQFYVGNDVLNSYGVQKAIMFGLSSVVADYTGNTLFSAAKIKKEMGQLDIEDMVVEPIFAGVTYALVNKYYAGREDGFMKDIIVGGATDFGAGVLAVPLRMYF